MRAAPWMLAAVALILILAPPARAGTVHALGPTFFGEGDEANDVLVEVQPGSPGLGEMVITDRSGAPIRWPTRCRSP